MQPRICTDMLSVVLVLMVLVWRGFGEVTNAELSLPNRETGKSFERVLGLGVVQPYPYFQKPRYRYPVYDANGRGKLLYGFGGKETFEYKAFTPIDGHH